MIKCEMHVIEFVTSMTDLKSVIKNLSQRGKSLITRGAAFLLATSLEKICASVGVLKCHECSSNYYYCNNDYRRLTTLPHLCRRI